MFAPVKVVLFEAVGFDACKYCGKHNKIVVTATWLLRYVFLFSYLRLVLLRATEDLSNIKAG